MDTNGYIGNGDNGNGKVTIAKLGVKLDSVLEAQKILIDRIDRHIEQSNVRDHRLTKLEVRCDHVEKDVCDQGKKLDDVRIKNNWYAGIVTFLAAVFSTLAAIFGGSR